MRFEKIAINLRERSGKGVYLKKRPEDICPKIRSELISHCTVAGVSGPLVKIMRVRGGLNSAVDAIWR